MAVGPDFIVLERGVDPNCRRSVRHDSHASYRTRMPPRGVSEATAVLFCLIASAKCGPRARKRAASKAHVPHPSFIIQQFAFSTNDCVLVQP